MHPEIASIHERLEKGGDWMEFRNESARLHGGAATQDTRMRILGFGREQRRPVARADVLRQRIAYVTLDLGR